MCDGTGFGRKIGNELYKVAFPIYRPLYAAFKACSDRAERRLLANQLSPGSVVVDAGANIGIYSRFLATCVGRRGAVHSFEPSPENFARLRKALSRQANIYLNQLAVGETSGETFLYVSGDLNVDHRAYPTEGEPRETISIRKTSLDDYFAPATNIDFIKMDIQGYELHALRGAERVLQENAALKMLIEFWPYGLRQAGTSADALLDFLAEREFLIYTLESDRLMLLDQPAVDPFDPTTYMNLFVRRRT